ncbi:MAG: DNA repair protein RadA [Bacteroidota bacterium]
MSKIKTAFFCQNCGVQSPKWLGRCTSCGEWNTFIEEVVKTAGGSKKPFQTTSRTIPVQDISNTEEKRIITGNNEFDRVLGGGIVNGSLVLIGGEPGIGKSTLLLQIALRMPGHKVLYVTGEENEQQLKMRADRIGIKNEQCFILTETSTQDVLQHVTELDPDIVIIDSIQTLSTATVEASPGTVSQIRECAAEMQRFAKTSGTPVILVGHITKDGMIAGPKLLEHMVDTVLQFEGDRNHMYRILRSVKNRFGSTSELGIYEMRSDGLREVENPSEILISQHDEPCSGVTVSASIEGMRPILIETQALVSTAAYGTPQRSATGFDVRRLNMLLAVLEKRCGFRLGVKDVFLNITGGIRVEDPAIDLGIVSAILSSNDDIPIPSKYCFAAEVGLSGEIRPVSKIENRISEAVKLGYEKIFISGYNLKTSEKRNFGIDVVQVKKIEEVYRILIG